jgi:hypothetical protein
VNGLDPKRTATVNEIDQDHHLASSSVLVQLRESMPLTAVPLRRLEGRGRKKINGENKREIMQIGYGGTTMQYLSAVENGGIPNPKLRVFAASTTGSSRL